jgi:hypothetical protein
MSRFRKDKKDDEEPDGTEAELEEGEEAGLFMASNPQQDEPAAEGGQAEADDLIAASPGEAASPGSGSAEQAEDLVSGTPVPTTEVEADSSESPRPSIAGETTPAADADETTPTTEIKVKTVPASEGATDDLMSAFRSGPAESEATGLMKEIEDVSMDELLADMREIVELLGLTVPEVDDSEDQEEAV